MGNAKNRKLCWNCDGSVHIHATKCPYCGTDLTDEPTTMVPQSTEESSPAHMQAAPAEPPPQEYVVEKPEPVLSYARVAPVAPPEQEFAPAEPEPMPSFARVAPVAASEPELPAEEPESNFAQENSIGEPELEPVAIPRQTNVRGVILPMLLLLPGAFFLLFSAILLLFAADGILTLQWNARYWMLYLVLALPLLYFGWRTLNTPDRESAQE